MLGWKIPSDAWNKYVLGGKGDYLEEFNGHTFEVSHVDATFPYGGITLSQFLHVEGYARTVTCTACIRLRRTRAVHTCIAFASEG
jgi:hypothetical protein